MKRTLLFIATACMVIAATAQPTLNYETHRLLPGADNPMTICKYQEAGVAGENIRWDYSGLEATNKEFAGTLKEPEFVAEFATSNTQLVEFNTNFFFEIDESGIQQTGYASNNFNIIVQYAQPFEKMRFPFVYGDAYSTPFSGDYSYKDKTIGSISGVGHVEADAWGMLILPNNTFYESTVRVKTTKNYEIEYSSSTSNVEIVTYRWYNSTHRYPLLVLTEFTTTTGTRTSTNYQAAYNNNAVNSPSAVDQLALNEHISIYPNPSKSTLFVDVYSENNSPAMISIYDITGKLVVAEQTHNLSVGKNTLDFSNKLTDLEQGTYLLNVRIGDQKVVRELSVAE